MRAAVYYNNSDVKLEDIPKPEIGKGELLVKIIASGICGSDVLEWYRIKKAPIVLGHEVSGIIEEVGSGVTGFSKGDRVVVSHHVPCNTCRYCLSGNHTVCETLQTTNFDPGGFCEYVRVPKINVNIGTFKLPDEVSFEDGSFCEALACVVRGQRKINFQAGQAVLVMGSGISGLLHIMLAKASGAEKIFATDVSDFKMDLARKAGADAAFSAMEDTPSLISEANNGRMVDLVIVCTGALSAFEQAIECVDRAGSILCFATTTPEDRLAVPLNRFWRSQVTITSSYANDPDDMREAMELIRAGKIDVNSMITHRLPLAETGKGFELMAQPDESLKIIIEPQN